jgi:hypothetical protein
MWVWITVAVVVVAIAVWAFWPRRRGINSDIGRQRAIDTGRAEQLRGPDHRPNDFGTNF